MKIQRIVWIGTFLLLFTSIFQSCKRVVKEDGQKIKAPTIVKPKVETETAPAQKAVKPKENRQVARAKAQNNYDQMIIGKWKDTNSLMEYRADGVFIGEWKEGTTAGQWAIFGDTLQMRFPLDVNIPEYKIIKFTEDIFKIKSLEDGTVFSKSRVE